MEDKSKLFTAIVKTSAQIKGVEKNSQVGSGKFGYKGITDRDVKLIVGRAMTDNGLSLLPIHIEPKITIDSWEETTQYGTKRKQNVFTEVIVKYLLIHESGQSMEISGYGHGIDSMDKGAGKACTYSMKYAMLYAFLVPTGDIDDTDSTHSNEIPEVVPSVKKKEVKKVNPNIGETLPNKKFKEMSDRYIKGEYDVFSIFMNKGGKLSKEQIDLVVATQNTIFKGLLTQYLEGNEETFDIAENNGFKFSANQKESIDQVVLGRKKKS